MFKIASGLSLPVDAATQTFALLGRRGSGKTSTAVVLAEEFLKAGQPIVWVDPIGVAWGLRSKFNILNAVIQQGGLELPVNVIAQLTGYESNGGSFKTYLSRVSALGLIERRNGQVIPTDLLFPEGLE